MGSVQQLSPLAPQLVIPAPPTAQPGALEASPGGLVAEPPSADASPPSSPDALPPSDEAAVVFLPVEVELPRPPQPRTATTSISGHPLRTIRSIPSQYIREDIRCGVTGRGFTAVGWGWDPARGTAREQVPLVDQNALAKAKGRRTNLRRERAPIVHESQVDQGGFTRGLGSDRIREVGRRNATAQQTRSARNAAASHRHPHPRRTNSQSGSWRRNWCNR